MIKNIIIPCLLIFVFGCSKIEDKSFMGLYPGMNKEQVFSRLIAINNTTGVNESVLCKHYHDITRIIGVEYSPDTLSFMSTYVYKTNDGFKREPYYCHLGFIDNHLYTIIIETEHPLELFNQISKGTDLWPKQHKHNNKYVGYLGSGHWNEITSKNCKILFANLSFIDYKNIVTPSRRRTKKELDIIVQGILEGKDISPYTTSNEGVQKIIEEKDYIIFISTDIQTKIDAKNKEREEQERYVRDSIENSIQNSMKKEYNNQIF